MNGHRFTNADPAARHRERGCPNKTDRASRDEPISFRGVMAITAMGVLASVVAVAIAIAILAYLMLLGGVGMVSSLETTVHGSDRSARASSPRSRPAVRTTPGGTAQFRPRPDFPRRPGGVA